MSRLRSRSDAAHEALDALGKVAGDRMDGEVSDAAHERGKRALVAALGEQREGGRRAASGWRARRAPVLLAAAVLAAAAAVLFWPRARLRYEVVGATLAPSAYVRVPASGPEAALRFSDGTEVVFAAGGRGRVAEVGARGARIVIESGRARVHVAHLPGAEWSVEAGPFAIAVTGTAFDVSWKAEEGELEVRLRVGSVVVRGPLSPAGVPMHAGQRLTARLGDRELRIVEETGSAGTTADAEAAAARAASEGGAVGSAGAVVGGAGAVVGTAAERVVGPAPSVTGAERVVVPAPAATANERVAAAPKASRREEAAPAWQRRVKAGDFRGVIADAEARGIDATLAEASLADLEALADAARYAGRADVAGKVLGAERARFPGTVEAKTAAFLLGRLAEDAQASPGAAIGYYDAYLAEAPDGAFASEALGRKMNAVHRSAGAAAARPIAEAYLRRFPGGSYAAVAQQIAAP
ncbi:MAG: FecR domain-containing protein [Minicystis sp.]